MLEPAACPDDLALGAWLDGRADADLDAHLDRCPDCLRAVAALGARTPAAALDGLDDAGRYQVVGALAAGGMGRVVLARDRRLDREVAIKVVRDPERPHLVSRLERELLITARLQHPAIVPVHDAGTTLAGEPFFVMPRVEGASLAARLAATPGFADRLALVPAVAGAVDAIAYAHAQGVLHRDLKPANVMLGPHGETLVIDWGLAVDRHAPADAAGPGLALGSGSGSEGDPAATATGAVLGTLGYMSPEQRAGGELDERTDVYGLGGILYHVLAGVAPHAGEGGTRRERPRPLRSLCAAPPALAAIVERALAAAPADRYPSAGELARELRRYLDGQLVGAHRYTLGERVRRWVARHRAAVIAGAAALIAVAAIATIAVRQVLASRRVAERERAEALRRGDAADRLIAFTLGDLHERLAAVGRLDVTRTVDEAVLRHYRELPVRAGAAGFVDRLRHSDALGLAGDERRAAGDLDAATAHYRDSLAVAEAAAAGAGPGERAQAETSLARAHQRVGDALADRGQLADAEAAQRTALTHAEAAVAAGAAAELVPATLVTLAELARRRGDDAAARALLERARPLAEAAGDGAAARRVRVVLLDQLGTLAYERGEVAVAARLFDDNLARLRAAPPADPDDAEYLEQLATLWGKVALGRITAGDSAGSLAAQEEARAVATRLTTRDPSNLRWLGLLDDANHGAGKRAQELGRADEARASLTASLELSRRIAALRPDDPRARRGLAVSALSLGALLQDQGALDEARARLDEARVLLEELSAGRAPGAPDADDVVDVLTAVMLQLAQVESLRKDDAAAFAAASRAVELTGALLAADPTPLHRMQHAESLLVAHDVRPLPALLERARAALAPLRATADPADARLAGLLAELFGP